MKRLAFLQGLLLLGLGISLPFQSVSAQRVSKPVSRAVDTSNPSMMTPEPSTPVLKGNSATGSRIMVVTAHPEATRIGYEVLKGGGSAADAAVAIQLVLGLVEPQSSGIGGGGFALFYNAQTKHVHTFDGRETAPQTAGRYLFIDDKGAPMEFYDAAVGGRAVGTPGMVRLLEMMHTKFGVKPWRDLFSPAITLAEQGFTVTPRLAALLDFDYDRLTSTTTATRLYFMPDAATPLQEGDVHTNPAYANTLRSIALQGPGAFYTGPIAEGIVKTVREFSKNPGLLSIEDLAAYRAVERKTVCGKYRAYMICTAGEPTSGGLVVLSALGMLEQFNLAALGENNPKSWNLILEASRLAFADRNEYMADPTFVQSPGELLIDPAYLKSRAALLSPDKIMPSVKAGVPAAWAKHLPKAAEPVYPKPPGTTHFTVVDGRGNIVSMTSSVEDAFGSRLYAEGFMLNNQLTDFSFVPEINKKPVANRVEGGKRPRSSMAPVIVFDPQGAPYLIIGSAGGSAIPGYVIQRIVALIDWKKDLTSALAMPNIIHRGPYVELESTGYDMEQPLRDIGHPLQVKDLNSGLTAIQFINGVMTGAADPRREGAAMGE
jgi:gamma-glutamyltranspeptidase/glutathione hydrolase